MDVCLAREMWTWVEDVCCGRGCGRGRGLRKWVVDVC